MTDTEKTNGREIPGVGGGSDASREQGADSNDEIFRPDKDVAKRDNTDLADSKEPHSPTSGKERDSESDTMPGGTPESRTGDRKPRETGKSAAQDSSGSTDQTDKPWKNAHNAAAARQRREAEQQAAIRKAAEDARVDAILEALEGRNPYTGEVMRDAEDVSVYLTQREIKARGGDPVQDFARTLADERRQASRQAADRAADEARQRADIDAFRLANPDVSLEELMADQTFADYAEGKLGVRPLTDIYRSYTSLREKYRTEERERAAQALANAQSSPGSVTGKSPAPSLSREQFLRKSYDERARFARENPDAYRVLMGR